MSFAQGLSSGFAMGSQLGNAIQDRRYTRALSAQEEEYKRLMEAGQAPTPGAGQVTEAAAPTAVVPGIGIAVPGAAAPEVMQATYDQGLAAQQQRVPSQMERLQAQRAIAAQYNRLDEVRRLDSAITQQQQYDTQLSEQDRRFGLQQKQFGESQRQFNERIAFEQQQYDAQLAEQERRFGLEQQRFDALQQQYDAQQQQFNQSFGLQQQTAQQTAARQTAADERISFSDIGASAANAVAMGQQLSPEQLEALRGNSVATNSFYKALEDKGIPTAQLGTLTKNFASGLDSLLQRIDSYKEEDALVAATNFAQQLDPNAGNNSPVRFIKQEDGSYLAEEGGITLAEGSIKDILTKFKNDLDSNPEGYGVQLYVLNQQQTKAAQNRFSQQLATSKVNAEQAKLAIDYIKAATDGGRGPRPGTPEYAGLEQNALRFAGVTGGLSQPTPLNQSVLDPNTQQNTGDQTDNPPPPPPPEPEPEPTIVEQVTGGLQSQAQKQREAREAASRVKQEARMQPGGDLFNREVSKVSRGLNSELRQLATEDMPSAIANITAQLEDGEDLSPIERAALEESRDYISQIYANRTK